MDGMSETKQACLSGKHEPDWSYKPKAGGLDVEVYEDLQDGKPYRHTACHAVYVCKHCRCLYVEGE